MAIMEDTTKVQMGADELFLAIDSNDSSYSLKKINEFKAAVKRLFVDIPQVPRYFEALTTAFQSRDITVSQTSFSAICHLIRRVSDQDPSPLASVHYLVLPVILSELSSDKSYIKSAARKALLSFWKSCGQLVQNYIRDKGLENDSPAIKNELLLILYDLIVPGFSFKPYLQKVVLLLDDENEEVSRNASNLLIKFFIEIVPNNKTARNDLVNDLREFSITRENALYLLNSIDTDLADQYNNVPAPEHLNTLFDPMNSFVSAGSIRVTTGKNAVGYTAERAVHEKPRSKPIYSSDSRAHTSLKSNPPSRRVSQPIPQEASHPVDLNVSEDIASILEETPCFQLDDISPIDVHSESSLSQEVDSMLAPFTDKETEFNWSKREKVIIRLRGLLRGNSHTDHLSALCHLLKSLKDGICKAVSSLRTTLSSNGCQLVKEIGIFLNSSLDSHLVELFIQPLIKLTVARKSISHQNAHVGVCALLVYCTFTPRILNYVYESSVNKNVQPRAYCGIWINLLLLRFKDNISVLESMGALESFTKALIKGISDPTPAVRESMRSAYWTINSLSPSHGEKILSKLDASTIKALERSRNGGNPPSNKSSRKPSVKELIISKQREQRASANSSRATSAGSSMESRSYSRSLSRDFSGHSVSSQLSKQRITSSHTVSYTEHMDPPKSTLDYTGAFRKHDADEDHTDTIHRYREPLPEQFSETGDQSFGEANHSDTAKSHDDRRYSEKHDFTGSALGKDVTIENPIPTIHDIFDLLSSTDKTKQRSGMELLEHELSNESADLPGKFRSVLDTLSTSNPQLFNSILLSGLGDKLARYLSSDNFVRLVCGVLSTQVDRSDQSEFSRRICKILSADDICISISNVVNSSVDTSTIENRDLTVLFMLNKQAYVRSCLVLARTCLTSLDLEDYLFSTLLEPLLKYWDLRVSDDEEEADDFITLMKLFYTKNSHIFTRCFNDLPESHSRLMLSVALGMSSPIRQHNDNSSIYNFSENETDGDDLDARMTDAEMDAANGITMVMHHNVPRNFESSKNFNSDMTMIVPKFTQQNKQKLSFSAASKSDNESNPFRVGAGRPVSRISEGDEDFDDTDGKTNIPDKIHEEQHNDSHDNNASTMDVDAYVSGEESDAVVSDPDLNRLSISEKTNLHLEVEKQSPPKSRENNNNNDNNNTDLIDLTDPLSSITNSRSSGSKVIEIFQDPVNESKDSDKVNVFEDDWSSFELRKYRAHAKYEVINPDDFSILNEKLSQKTIVESEFAKLISLTESVPKTNSDFELLQTNVLNYLNHDIKRNYALHCLLLLRLCILRLGSNDELITKEIWNKCISICATIEEADDDVFYGLIETVELIDAKPKILGYSIDSLTKINKLQSSKSKHLKIFTMSVIYNSFGDYISYEQVYSLDNALMKNIKSNETTIRRLAILNFSKLYELSLDKSKDVVAPVLFDKLDSSQLELVRYYTTVT